MNTNNRTERDTSLSFSRQPDSYRPMHQYNLSKNIQTNIDQCMDPSVPMDMSMETEINVARPFIYTILIFLTLCLVSYIASA
jgi:hypothetical protein